MKVVLKDGRRYILRFDRDEDVISGLLTFAEKEHISAAVFDGIGACTTIELGYYNEHLKDYRRKPILDNMEITSLIGNIGICDNKPMIHAHGTFSNYDFAMIGGHVFKLIVSVTCEVFLTELDGEMKREENEDFKLKLLI